MATSASPRRRTARPSQTFLSGDIDGAWVPEPWATRLIQEGGGKVLVDERDLWPEGQYVTTHLMVATKFLEEHPDVVQQFLEGQVAANDVRERQRGRGQDPRQRRRSARSPASR